MTNEITATAHVKALMAKLALPSHTKAFANLNDDDCLTMAIRFNASEAVVSVLPTLELTSQRWHLKRAMKSMRAAAISACRQGDGVDDFPLTKMKSFITWENLTPADVSSQEQSRDSRFHGQSLDGSTLGDIQSQCSSELASSAEINELKEQLRFLREKVTVLSEERGAAPDDDDDRTAGGRRLVLTSDILERLPDDPVRAELRKPELASILRAYPLPKDYLLKAGELSADEKSKLSPLVLEEITRLGKTINKYFDVARPLLSLANSLQGLLDGGHDTANASEVLDMVFDAVKLLLHHNSKLENERHMAHFKDEKVLQSVFQKKPAKSFFNDTERVAMAKLAEEQKVIRKIREDVRGGKSSKGIKKGKASFPSRSQLSTPRASTTAPPTPGMVGGGRGRGTGDKFRRTPHAGKGGKGKGGKSGEARGAEDSSAQHK
jgi:hypothetical protein